MTVELRFTRPCQKRCRAPLPLCGAYRRLLEHAVTELNELSSLTGLRTPDWDLAVECRCFTPHAGERLDEDTYTIDDE